MPLLVADNLDCDNKLGERMGKGRMIHCDQVVKRFGVQEVLRGITLSVERGETAVIVGPSGSGKSTFLRCLNGLETFDQGKIVVGEIMLPPYADRSLERVRLLELRRRVGMVFQQFHLFSHLSILGNVMEGPMVVLGHPRAVAADRARQLLDRVGLGDKLDARPHQLSGGQQQRVAIARALAMSPEVILFDEPTSALDPRMTLEVLAVMADLSSSGQTMVVVTHAVHFARRAARRLHVFCEGQLVESGSPESIFEEPRHAATIDFVREATSSR